MRLYVVKIRVINDFHELWQSYLMENPGHTPFANELFKMVMLQTTGNFYLSNSMRILLKTLKLATLMKTMFHILTDHLHALVVENEKFQDTVKVLNDKFSIQESSPSHISKQISHFWQLRSIQAVKD